MKYQNRKSKRLSFYLLKRLLKGVNYAQQTHMTKPKDVDLKSDDKQKEMNLKKSGQTPLLAFSNTPVFDTNPTKEIRKEDVKNRFVLSSDHEDVKNNKNFDKSKE